MRMTFEQREQLPYEDEREELFHKEVYRKAALAKESADRAA